MDSLIDQLITQGYLKSPDIIKAFKTIKRQDFVLPEDKERYSVNHALPIGYGQTISQPATVAFMLELLGTRPGDTVLDIGAGSGWQSSLIAFLVGEKGKVYAIERIPELVDFGQNNTKKYNFVDKGIIDFLCQDGSAGLPEQAPFDKIIIAAAHKNVPAQLKEQLKIGGRLVMPVGPAWRQDMVVLDKIAEDTYQERRFPGFIFVPLIQDRKQVESED